jgi:C1A family cysteine protease
MKPLFSSRYEIPEDKKKLISQMTAAMIAHDTPVGIGYDPAFLQEGEGHKGTRTGHASVIVGTHWNSDKNTCEFKLRNSWGSNCAIYAPEYQKKCVGGNIWISTKDLTDQVGSIFLVMAFDKDKIPH